MAETRQRLDKWLWHARMFKTRSQATAFSASGKVRINGERARKASLAVGPDDVLTFAHRDKIRILKITSVAVRRGPYFEAVDLYEDLSPPAPRKETGSISPGMALPLGRERGQGRPTKRDRRLLDRWNRRAE